MIKKLLIYAFIILIISCASDYKRAPDGGERDEIAPEVEYITPPVGETNVSKDYQIDIDFNEFIKYSSTRDAITISPTEVEENTEIDWGERSVSLDFNNLPENTTVVAAITTVLKDEQGNNLSENIIIPFSTGNNIDSGQVKGSADIYFDKDIAKKLSYRNTLAYLYDYATFTDTTLRKTKPSYKLGFDENNKFNFKYLSDKKYLLLVFSDLNRNGILDIDNDEPFNASIVNIDVSKENYYFLSKKDTIPPSIDKVDLLNSELLKVTFTEPLGYDGNFVDSVKFVDSEKNYYKNELFIPENGKELYILTDSLKNGEYAELKFKMIKDVNRNSADSLFLKRNFFVSDTITTQKLDFLKRFTPTLTEDDTLKIYFNKDDISSLSFYKFETQKDSIDENITDNVIKNPFYAMLIPNKVDMAEGKQILMISSPSDTLYYNNLNIKDLKGKGSISGEISNFKYTCRVYFENIGQKQSSYLKIVDNNEFKVSLEPGNYKISAIEDKDGSGDFTLPDFKNSFTSERATVYQDTVRVRKNWETSGIILELK